MSTKESWTQQSYVDCFESFWRFTDNCDRINEAECSPQEFISKYEMPYKPVVITGCQNEWKAKDKWTLEKLSKKYRNQKFKCGEDNEGYSVKLKMKYYVHYMLTTKDDSPLYIFDSNFGEVSDYFVIATNCVCSVSYLKTNILIYLDLIQTDFQLKFSNSTVDVENC